MMVVNSFPLNDAVKNGIEVGRGISELGLLVIAAAFFIVFSIITMLFMYWLMRKLVGDLIKKRDTEDGNLNNSITKLAQYLEPMSNESLLRNMDILKKIAYNEFDLSIEKVCNIILTMKAENHIYENEAYVKAKLRRLVTNIHRDRNIYFSSLRFSGHTLSYYTNPKWDDSVYAIAVEELYNPDDNVKRMRTNVKSVYEEIKIEFSSNLMNR